MRKTTKIQRLYSKRGVVPFDPLEPEKNLLRAILSSAMNDVKRRGNAAEEAKLFL